mmetsp:Transcript_13722/g.37734  ORF Transcript_13722/g.37734 Transcript_13722/m.37734 type:complete len:267 (-) Transcript_13722:249-1049(-)
MRLAFGWIVVVVVDVVVVGVLAALLRAIVGLRGVRVLVRVVGAVIAICVIAGVAAEALAGVALTVTVRCAAVGVLVIVHVALALWHVRGGCIVVHAWIVLVHWLLRSVVASAAWWQGFREGFDHVGSPDPEHGRRDVHAGSRGPGAFVVVAKVAAPSKEGERLANEAEHAGPEEPVEGWELEGNAAGAHDDAHDEEAHDGGDEGHCLSCTPHGVEVLLLFIAIVEDAGLVVAGLQRSGLTRHVPETFPRFLLLSLLWDGAHVHVVA